MLAMEACLALHKFYRQQVQPELAPLEVICPRSYTFKVATLTFKAHKLGQPSYLEPLVQSSEVGRDLRSSTRAQGLLNKPRTRTEIGTRRFSSAAPVVWNALSASARESVTIGSFKSHLMTHLLHQHLD